VSLPYKSFRPQHLTLVASTDTTITFPRTVEAVRVRNWDTANRVLVSMEAITSDVDATADRVGKAGATDIPTVSTFPVRTDTIHIRSAGASEVTVSGYY
jgi:hypothetical protein